MGKIIWEKPNKTKITTNDEPATIKEAKRLKWKEVKLEAPPEVKPEVKKGK